jgi:hypothetical protein
MPTTSPTWRGLLVGGAGLLAVPSFGVAQNPGPPCVMGLTAGNALADRAMIWAQG